MTDFIDSLLTSMSSKFNETNTDLAPINLNEDKTLKWRGLHNNQYAAVKKRKDGKRNEKATTTTAQAPIATTTTTTIELSSADSDPPPLMNATCTTIANVNADDVVTRAVVTQTDEQKNNNRSEVVETCIIESSENIEKPNDSIGGMETKNIVNTNKMERTNNNDKERINDTKDDDQRPFRRTLRRKQNSAMDETIDELMNVTNRKIGLRSTRQSSASGGSANENRSVSPKRERERDKDEKLEKSISDTALNIRNSVMTRQRGRARKIDGEHSSIAADESNDSLPKAQSERNASFANEVDDGSANNQPTPPKLRRSIRMHSSVSSDHTAEDRTTSVAEQKLTDLQTRSRKRTVDDKKVQEQPTNDAMKEEKFTDHKSVVPSVMIEVDISNDEKVDDIKIKKSDDSSEVIENVAVEPTSEQIARKRGRKPAAKAKANLKLNTSISTRNSPVKKSPRFSSDESPFCYTIPKKDKAMDQPVSLLKPILFFKFQAYFYW